MNRSRLAPAMLPLLLGGLASVACADEYRWQARGSFDRAYDSGPYFADSNALALSGSWYFAPVRTDGVPLAEAAFLGRASSLSAMVARLDVFDTDLDAQGLNVSWYLPGNWLYASVSATRSEFITALSSTFVVKEKDTNVYGTLGITPIDGLRITTNIDEDGYDPNLSARYVGKLPNGHFYAGGASIVDADFGDTAFGLDFDYYLDETASLGVGYGDDGFQETWELRAEKFFAKSWAVGASAYTNDYGDGFGLHVTWRH
jgi:hypothetical protein